MNIDVSTNSEGWFLVPDAFRHGPFAEEGQGFESGVAGSDLQLRYKDSGASQDSVTSRRALFKSSLAGHLILDSGSHPTIQNRCT